MKIRICMVTMTPELAYDAMEHVGSRATGEVTFSIVANCCKLDTGKLGSHGHITEGTVLPAEESLGVVPAMTRMWEEATRYAYPVEEIFFYIHDDCRILEQGWDDRLRRRFEQSPGCDAVGLVGGTGIGHPQIYRLPYETIQLARHNVWSNMSDAESHGRRRTDDIRIATADGCALAVRRSFLDKHNGWTWCPVANHGYDNGLAGMLRRHGREFWLVPLAFEHPSKLKFSGLPTNQKAVESYVKKYGTDHENYVKAHRWLYDEFRDVLPFHV